MPQAEIKDVRATKGPWSYRRQGTGSFHIYGPDNAGDHSGAVAMALHRREIEERVANAHLIAAAPTMAEAIANVLRDLREVEATGLCGRMRIEQIAELDSALAKAEGRS